MGILFRYLQTAIVNLSVSVFLIRTVAPAPILFVDLTKPAGPVRRKGWQDILLAA